MAKKRTSKRRTSSNKKANNSLLLITLVIIIIALLAFIITYILMNDVKIDNIVSTDNTSKIEKTIVNQDESIENQNKKPDKKENNKGILEGTWVSNNDGAMLTIKGTLFSIEQPSVDSPQKDKGTLIYNGNRVTFINNDENSECGQENGEYNFVLENDEVTFSVINDNCKSRITQLECGWFKL